MVAGRALLAPILWGTNSVSKTYVRKRKLTMSHVPKMHLLLESTIFETIYNKENIPHNFTW